MESLRTIGLLALTILFAGQSLAQASLLRVRAFAEPQTLDWNKASTWVEGFVIRNLMEGLVGVDSKLKPIPLCAETWKQSEEGRVFTFFLRKDLKWSDGVPLKAQHFADSWQRLLSPATKAKYASTLFDIEGAEAYNSGGLTDFKKVGIKVINDTTLEVRLKAAISHWFWITSFYATFPIRKDLLAKYDLDWTQAGNLVTNGPWVQESHDFGRKMMLGRNKHYPKIKSNIDKVELAMIPDDSVALKMYQMGELDLLEKIPSSQRNRLKTRPDFHSWADLRTIHLRLNVSKNPMSNQRLRKAIAQAIDHSKISKIFANAFIPASSFVAPNMLAYDKKAGAPFNPEKARAELKQAGFDASKLPPLDLLTVSFDDQIILAQFVQEELKRNLGLNVKIHILEPKRYYSPSLAHQDYDMQINFWGADFPDPDNFFSVFLSNSGLNKYKWSNQSYDKLVLQARVSPNLAARKKAYTKAQDLLLKEDIATIPLYYGSLDGLVSPKVKGFKPGPLNWWSLKDLSLF